MCLDLWNRFIQSTSHGLYVEVGGGSDVAGYSQILKLGLWEKRFVKHFQVWISKIKTNLISSISSKCVEWPKDKRDFKFSKSPPLSLSTLPSLLPLFLALSFCLSLALWNCYKFQYQRRLQIFPSSRSVITSQVPFSFSPTFSLYLFKMCMCRMTQG